VEDRNGLIELVGEEKAKEIGEALTPIFEKYLPIFKKLIEDFDEYKGGIINEPSNFDRKFSTRSGNEIHTIRASNHKIYPCTQQTKKGRTRPGGRFHQHSHVWEIGRELR
jgi:hypothetical protein